MALVDHEKVLAELEEFFASKPHHGSKDLALKLAELRAKHTLDETLLEHALRVYGHEAAIELRRNARDSHRDDRGGSSSPVADGEPAHRPHDRTEEVHDGSRDREAAAAG